MMLRLKKVFYFLLGMVVVPVVLGEGLSFLIGCDVSDGVRFFGLVYFLVYLMFPVLYRGKIAAKFRERYVFYGVLYLPFVVLFLMVY